MIDGKTLNLLIRAKLEGKGDIDAVTKSITALEKSIEAQTAAANRGESSIDELKASLEALKQIQNDLTGRADLVGTFQRSGAEAEKLSARVATTARKLEELKAKIAEKGGDPTAFQQERLGKLEKSYAAAQERAEAFKRSQAELEDALKRVGIDTNNLAEAERNLRDTAAQLATTQLKVKESISGYGEAVRRAREEERARREEMAKATKEADQFAAAEKRAAEAAAARVRAAEEVQQVRRDRAAASAAEKLAFDQEAEQNRRAIELAQKRRDVEAAFQDDGLRQTADDAERAAKSYSTLARASTDLRPKVVSLRDALDAIRNPSAQVQSTLGGVEGEVTRLATTIDGIKGKVKDYQGQLRALDQAQKSLSSQAALIDNFNRQSEALAKVERALNEAEAEVSQYAAAVRKGGDDGAKFVKSLSDAEQKAKAAASALAAQLQATNAAREQLKSAGISTSDLSGAQQRLIDTTRKATTATDQLNAAVKKYGVENEKVKKTGGLFSSEGERTTLSYMQRLRGEVLALTTAYVGLNGAINLAKGAIDAAANREASRAVLGVGLKTTDRKAIDEEYAYVKAQSERIGLEIDSTVKNYSKLLVAGSAAGRSKDEIRFIFEAFSEAGRVIGLTQEQLEGVTKALTDSFSKGKIGAEELKEQLGDRLPGILEVAQQALRDQFPDLQKAMEQGKVGSEQWVKVAEAYRKLVADQLPGATAGMIAQQARLNNAINEFKLAIADSGFTEAYTEALQKITQFLRSDDGKDFAETTAKAFTRLAQLVVLILDNFDELTTAAEIFLALWAGGKVAGMLSSLSQAATALPLLSKGFAGLTTAVRALGIALAAVAIAKWAWDNFEIVRQLAVSLAVTLDSAFTKIKYAIQILFVELGTDVQSTLATILNSFLYFARKTTSLLQNIAQAAGFEDAAKVLGNALDAMTFKTSAAVTSRVAQLKAQMASDLKTIEDAGFQMFQDVSDKKPSPSTPDSRGNPTAMPKGTAGKPTGAPSDAEIKKRQNDVQEIRNALDSLAGRIDRAKSETLAVQLQGIDKQYAPLLAKIRELGGKEAKAFEAELVALKTRLSDQITRTFNEGLAKSEQELQAKLEQIEAAAGRKSKDNLKARLDAIESSYAETFRKIDEYIKELSDNQRDTAGAEAIKARTRAAVEELKVIEELKVKQEQLNKLIDLRDRQVGAVRAQKDAGNIDSEAAAEQINQINEAAIPGIQAAAEATREWALAHKEIFGNPEELQIFLDSLAAVATTATQVKTEFSDLDNLLINGALSGLDKTIDSAVDSLQAMFDGTKSIKQGFGDMLRAAGQFFAAFLRDIAVAIIKLTIFNAMKNSGNPILSAIGTAGAKSVKLHEGGIVGRAGSGRRVTAPSEWFANAPRYHTGGIAGLAPDEYPAILKRNEEVLTDNSPRNILNGGAAANGGNQQQASSTRFVLVDDRAKVAEAMASADGEEVVLMHLRRNAASVKQILR